MQQIQQPLHAQEKNNQTKKTRTTCDQFTNIYILKKNRLDFSFISTLVSGFSNDRHHYF